MSDAPAKRQAYSFAFPPDKKQAFTKIADEKYQRPASWLLLAAIDQVIANGGLLGEEPSPAQVTPPTQASIDISDVLVGYVPKDNWDDLAADVADLRQQLAQLTATASVTTHTDVDPAAIQAYIDRCCGELRAEIEALKGTTTTTSASAKATTKKTPAKPKGV